jgi:hypothetical protein
VVEHVQQRRRQDVADPLLRRKHCADDAVEERGDEARVSIAALRDSSNAKPKSWGAPCVGTRLRTERKGGPTYLCRMRRLRLAVAPARSDLGPQGIEESLRSTESAGEIAFAVPVWQLIPHPEAHPVAEARTSCRLPVRA